ncbi:uncharacterized protein LOC111083778 [Limulus polyphemus]|uniref:Uncharacterized protein LOC111083778 n=1 Tax=Limulus polyphemus TaxID=6850 RepID=A0ABM1RXS2_LIMPO|nr:uncharacterized protein LOC111083778 [Limulus polyphemus]
MPNVTNSPDGELPRLHCHNLVKLLGQYVTSVSSNHTQSEDGDIQPGDDQNNALMYIVVVLLFYSCGIAIMMIKYMRKEAKEQEECKMYRRYINAAHEQYLNSMNRARLANRLALQALNTVNAIPQTTQLGSKVTFV